MTIPSLGTLTDASLREAWDHEAHSFTPWLAAHLYTLANVIGIPLELEGVEVAVDTYFADILARTHRDELVLIENQLEGTDHTHLGQVMTYLAGLDAKIVVWIAADFREPHLSAIRWLNDNTVEPFAFFAVKVRVVRIGDSPLAPIFDVMERPNQWERRLQTVADESYSLSEIGQFRKAFWTYYLERYPEDLADGPASGVSNRWRTLPHLGLIISYYISKSSVGLFIRGRRGATDDEVVVILSPYATNLATRLDTGFASAYDGYFFLSSMAEDTTNRDTWNRSADWLHQKLTLYTAALQELESDHGA